MQITHDFIIFVAMKLHVRWLRALLNDVNLLLLFPSRHRYGFPVMMLSLSAVIKPITTAIFSFVLYSSEELSVH